MKKIALILFLSILISPVVFAQTESGARGIFGTTATPLDTASFFTNVTGDTVTGRIIYYGKAVTQTGDMTVILQTTLDSGSYPTCVVELRKIYKRKNGTVVYGSYFQLGTFAADGTFEYTAVGSSNWFYCYGYQIRVRGVGTFDTDIVCFTLSR